MAQHFESHGKAGYKTKKRLMLNSQESGYILGLGGTFILFSISSDHRQEADSSYWIGFFLKIDFLSIFHHILLNYLVLIYSNT